MNKCYTYLIKINNLVTKNQAPKMDGSNLIDKKEIVQLIDDLKKAILEQCSFKEGEVDDSIL